MAVSFVAFALMDMSRGQWAQNQALYGKIQVLESFRDAPDLRSHLAKNEHEIQMALMHEIDVEALLFEIERTAYSDRAPLVAAVSTLKERRGQFWRVTDRTLSIFGVSVPVATWFYLVPFVALILFHQFTQIVFFRGRLLDRIGAIEDWEQGPFLVGFRRATSSGAPARFLRALSTLVATGFLIFPALVSFLFIMSSYNLTSDFDRASSSWVLTLNWLCLLSIVLEIAMVMHHENVLGFRGLIGVFRSGGAERHVPAAEFAPADVVTDPPRASHSGGIAKLLVWASIPPLTLVLHFFTEAAFGDEIVPVYLLVATGMSCILPLALALRSRFSGSRPLAAMTFVGAIVAFFWLAIPPLVWFDFLRYTHANPHEITMLSFGILAGACVLSIPYARWPRIDGEGDTGTA